MAICDLKNPDLQKIAEGKQDLKSKMTEGLSGLGSMADIQKKMNEGFKGLTSGATGPALVCQCSGGDPLASTESECLATGGSWVCKEVENFNLQQELLSLNDKSPIDFAAGVQSIKEKFGELVPDLTDKINTISPAMGDFFKNFEMPALPKAGDTVLNCNCVGGDPLASTEDECLDSGGSWVCTEETLAADLGSTFASKIQGGIGSITSFFSNKTGETAGTGGIPSLSDAFSKFDTAIKGAEIPSFPKPGEKAVICNCVGGAGVATNEAECNEIGGKWVCEIGIAPEIPNIFGADGLPKISKETMCNAIDNVEVKDTVKTDPQTGIQSIIKIADTLPKEPELPKVEPAPPVPPPTTESKEKDVLGGASVGFASAQKTIRNALGRTMKKANLVTDEYTNMWFWIYREGFYKNSSEVSQDASNNPGPWKRVMPIGREDVEKSWDRFKNAYADAVKDDKYRSKTLDSRIEKVRSVFIKQYTNDEALFNGNGSIYGGEKGLNAWFEFKLEQSRANGLEIQASKVKEVEQEKAPAPAPNAIANVKTEEPVKITQKEAEKELDLSAGELKGTQTHVFGDRPDLTVTYNADEVKLINPDGGTWKLNSDGTTFSALDQTEYDLKIRVAKNKETATTTRTRSNGTSEFIAYYVDRGNVYVFVIEKYGLDAKKQAAWDKKKQSVKYTRKLSALNISPDVIP